MKIINNKLKLKLIAIFAFVVCCSNVEAAEQKILCFGDSITHHGKWVKVLDRDRGLSVINAGRSGRRVSQAAKEIVPYLEKHKDLDKIILFLGVNDLPARNKSSAKTKIRQCSKDMSKAIDIALKYVKNTEDVILVAPCDVNPAIMNQSVLSKGYDITSPLLKQLEAGYEVLAKKKKISFLSLYNVVSKKNYTDGVHPNAAGDDEIAKALLNYLKPSSKL